DGGSEGGRRVIFSITTSFLKVSTLGPAEDTITNTFLRSKARPPLPVHEANQNIMPPLLSHHPAPSGCLCGLLREGLLELPWEEDRPQGIQKTEGPEQEDRKSAERRKVKFVGDLALALRKQRDSHRLQRKQYLLTLTSEEPPAEEHTNTTQWFSAGPPHVTEKIVQRQMVRIGRTLKLQCPVEANPPPLIMWTKDGRNIHSGWMRFRVLQQALRIKDVEAEDAGTFICKATNGFGSVNINYTLIVIDPSSSRWTFVLLCVSFEGRLPEIPYRTAPSFERLISDHLSLLLVLSKADNDNHWGICSMKQWQLQTLERAGQQRRESRSRAGPEKDRGISTTFKKDIFTVKRKLNAHYEPARIKLVPPLFPEKKPKHGEKPFGDFQAAAVGNAFALFVAKLVYKHQNPGCHVLSAPSMKQRLSRKLKAGSVWKNNERGFRSAVVWGKDNICIRAVSPPPLVIFKRETETLNAGSGLSFRREGLSKSPAEEWIPAVDSLGLVPEEECLWLTQNVTVGNRVSAVTTARKCSQFRAELAVNVEQCCSGGLIVAQDQSQVTRNCSVFESLRFWFYSNTTDLRSETGGSQRVMFARGSGIRFDDSGAGKDAARPAGESESSTDLTAKLVRPRFTQPAKMRKRVIARPVGSSVRLKCTASGNPRPDIVWLKDSRPLSLEEVGEGRKKKWTLSLKNLMPEHSGKYTCQVSNRVGEINATYKVEVIQRTNSKPILTGTHPVNTTVDYGGTTSFQCKVRSDVKPVIQWLKRVEPGEESKYNSTIEVGDHHFVVLPTGDVWSRPDGSYLNKLLITRAKEEDAGMYICLGANTMGYSFRSAFLTVLPDPKPPFSTIPSVMPPILPWPVIIGIPAGVVFILGSVLLWFCQSRKHCSSGAIISGQTLPNGHRQPSRERQEKDCMASASYEEYLAQQQQQLLLAQAVPKVFPKSYSDIHTHSHSHVDGKVHQHQHIHYQC
ncbi:hypothetical protein DNTS_014639, partial [Danionella cerebrum]